MSKKKVLLRGVFINRDTNGEGVLKVGTTLIRVSTVMGILYGRSILPTFMDPDYNGNWDLEFDNVEGRCSVEKWILYDLLKKKWERMRLGDHSKQIVNTLYGNPLRRAWIELNYIYFYIIREIEKMSFKLFVTDAEWFLSNEEDIRQQMSGVNLCSLRLSDMGNTTLGVTAPPYDEIAQEAFSVWELFEGKYR